MGRRPIENAELAAKFDALRELCLTVPKYQRRKLLDGLRSVALDRMYELDMGQRRRDAAMQAFQRAWQRAEKRRRLG